MQSIAKIPDGITREVYIDKCKLLEIGKQELDDKVHELIHKGKVAKSTKRRCQKGKDTSTPIISPAKSEFQEKDIIRFMLQYGDYQINPYDEREKVLRKTKYKSPVILIEFR